MQLPQQLLKQTSILLDKPISPKVTKQLHTFLLHDNIPQHKTIHLLSSRYRSDLLIFMFQNNRFPKQLSKFTTQLMNNILEYRLKVTEVIQIYLLMLNRLHQQYTISATDGNMQNDNNKSIQFIRKQLLQLSYSSIIKNVIKQPNLQTKQILMKIICANIQYLYSIKHKKIIQIITQNYIQVYNKYLMYVCQYVRMLEIIINIDYNSKKLINQKHPQKSQINISEEIFIDLSSQQLAMLCEQTLKIMENTILKVNYHQLHRNCLKVVIGIGRIIEQFRVKEGNVYFGDVKILRVIRLCEKFVQKKGTIDEGKSAGKVWQKIKAMSNQQKKQKMVKNYRQQPIQQKPPILIQNIIALTNNYRLKYEVQKPIQDKQIYTGVSVSNNYLRKGQGLGGGRTTLISKQKVNGNNSRNQNNDYNKLIDSCLGNFGKQFQFRSYVDPVSYLKPVQQIDRQMQFISENSRMSNKYINNNNSKMTNNNNNSNNSNNNNYYQNQQLKYNIKIKNNNNNSSIITQQLQKQQQLQQQNDEEILQINNLIDLAYSYKFA